MFATSRRPSVTLSVFNNAGPTSSDIFGHTIGSNIYRQTFSSFASDISTADGTNVVTIGLPGGLSLVVGNTYDVFVTNPSVLVIPLYFELGSGGAMYTKNAPVPPVEGVAYTGFYPDDIAIGFYTNVVPGPTPGAGLLSLAFLVLAGVWTQVRSFRSFLYKRRSLNP